MDPSIPFDSAIDVNVASSLSGPLSGYTIQLQSRTPAGPVYNFTAKQSYQARFREERRVGGILEDRLKKVEGKLVKMVREMEEQRQEMDKQREEMDKQREGMDKQREGMDKQKEEMDERRQALIQIVKREIYQETCFKTMEVYSCLGNVLQDRWFPSLPGAVRSRLNAGPSTILSRVFTSWWVVWNGIDPNSYPLPLGLLLSNSLSFNPPTGDVYDWTSLLVASNQSQTPLGVAVHTAWEHITEADRELMLFCWAASRDFRKERNDLAHPKPTSNSATAMINHDLKVVEARQLRDLAIELISQSPHHFTVHP